MAKTQCDNCGRLIGRLETSCRYGNHVVCTECLARLSSAPLLPPPVQQARSGGTKWLWIGGFFFVLGGLGSFGKHPDWLAGPFLIIAGGLLLPPVWASLAANWPGLRRWSTFIRGLACMLAIGIVVLVMPKPAPQPSSTATPNSPLGGTSSSTPRVPAASTGRQWYDGGTLHQKTMRDWRDASYADRLATCADFVTATAKKRGLTLSSMDEVKVHAVRLEKEISAAGAGGHADSIGVSEVAAGCLVLMDKE